MTPEHEKTVEGLRIKVLENQHSEMHNALERVTQLAMDHQEQINGKRGLYSAIEELSGEIKSLRRAIAAVGTGIIVAAISFALEVLK